MKHIIIHGGSSQVCAGERNLGITMFADNLSQLKTRIAAMIAAGRVPIVFLDLDDTLNKHFGAPVEEQVVATLQILSEAGGLFGLNKRNS